jgi:uncharacterized DUF497 family protein
MSDFDWDEENKAHIARHRIKTNEVGEFFAHQILGGD